MQNPQNSKAFWSEYLPLLEERGIAEAVGSVFFKNESLNRWLRHSLEGRLDPANALMADPLFEAVFPQMNVEPTFEELSERRWGRLFSRSMIEALPPKSRKHHPYKHQFETFQRLCARDAEKRESLIIASGTGSGKTECFFYPILEDLCREMEAGTLSKPGIRGLILYPLNALINDQKQRLNTLFKHFGGAMRYCRYTGELRETCEDNLRRGADLHEVQCRRDMRRPEKMPHLLLTNPSMLDRMLLRPSDKPLIEETRENKTFRWIVLDEAHNYLGSKAADLALLLRRMLIAFNADPNTVHFIAASATVETSNEEAKASLLEFLMQISGADADHVHLIVGERKIPSPCDEPRNREETLDELAALPVEADGGGGLASHLRRSSTAMAIRDRFIREGSLSLSDVVETIRQTAAGQSEKHPEASEKPPRAERGGRLSDPEKIEALRWLDLLTAPKDKDQLLSLRLHLMMNTTSFIQACPDPNCTALDPELKGKADWPFGQPWLDGRRRCACGAPLFPLAACGHCSSVFLKATAVNNGIETVLVRPEDENAAKRAEEERLSRGEAPDDEDADEEGAPAAASKAESAENKRRADEKEDDPEDAALAYADARAAQDASEAGDDLRAEVGPDQEEIDWNTAKTVLIEGANSPDRPCGEGSEMDGIAYVKWTDESDEGEAALKEVELRIRRPKERMEERSAKKGKGCRKGAAEAGAGNGIKLQCPSCGANLKSTSWHLRRIDAGYVNSLMPLMLDYSGPAAKDACKPMSGRKVLSFTDSRAATAMNGAVIEREGERCYAASRIYEALMPRTLTPDEEEELEDCREDAARARAEGKDRKAERYERRIAELTGQPTCTWKALRKKLADEIHAAKDCVKNAHDGTGNDKHPLMHFVRMLRVKNNDPDPADAAEILLLREFGYRPVNAANLETCGLVKLEYPELAHAAKPSVWPLSAEDWRSYLKILIDFVVRANHAIAMNAMWRALGGKLQIYEHVFLPADEYAGLTAEERKKQPWLRSWPNASSGRDRTADFTSRLLGFGRLANAGKAEKAEVDLVLRAAFEALKDCRILVKENDGWRMHLDEQTTFAAPEKVWRFAGTNKLYDTIVGSPELAVCPTNPDWQGASAVEMPKPETWRGAADSLESRNKLRRAVQSSSAVQDLIEKGAWNRFGTYALERPGYFAAAEHTAQVDKLDRSQFEDDFSEGIVNFLSCSTTMEMGVDLDDIGSVMLNGVPPHPANYLQRIGRAGRREETRANAVTFCRSRPLERRVFADPAWALKAEQPRPSVHFTSRSIVQRHVNAVVLRQFLVSRLANPGRFRMDDWLANLQPSDLEALRASDEEDLSKINFSEGRNAVAGEESLARLFQAWTRQLTENAAAVRDERRALEEALFLWLVPGTCLEDLSFEDLVCATAEQMKKADNEARREIQSYQSRIQEARAAGPDKERYLKGLQRQLDYAAKRDFFSYMAEKLVLPSSIRVLNAVFFDPRLDLVLEDEKLDSKHTRRRKNNNKHADDSDFDKGSPFSLPSREGRVGIFEYAPGASVVIENTVHRSGGVMVDWESAASDDGSRNQRIVKVCACSRCGDSFFAPISEEKPLCPSCGAEASSSGEALIPKGFVSDDRQHLDVSQVSYYVRERPKVRMEGAPWTEAGPGGLRVRASADAELMAVNRGRERNGRPHYFAVCLACGFAQLMQEGDDIKEKVHQAMSESSAGVTNLGKCKCSQLKLNLSFATSWRTDCLQLEFSNLSRLKTLSENERRDELPNRAADEKIESAAVGAAAALRRAVAEHCGISENEILWTWETRDRESKLLVSLYDREKGGFTSGAADALPEILGRAIDIVKNCTCASACPRCIQAFDTDRDGRRLDRHDALALFEDNGCRAIAEGEGIAGLAGDSTQFLMKPLEAWLADAGASLRKVVFFAAGKPAEGFAPNATDIYDALRRLSERKRAPEVELAACGFDWKSLGAEAQGQLSNLSRSVRFMKTKAPESADAESLPNLVAVVKLANGALHAFAVHGEETDVRAFLGGWQLAAAPESGLQLLHGIAKPEDLPELEEAERPELKAAQEDRPSASFTWSAGKNRATTATFGRLLWKAVAGQLSPGAESLRDLFPDDPIAGMFYSDRYIVKAGDAALLLSIAKGAAESLGVADGAAFTVKTWNLQNPQFSRALPQRLYHSWRDEERRGRFFGLLEDQAKRAKARGASSIEGLELRFEVEENSKPQFAEENRRDGKAAVIHDRILRLRLASGRGIDVTIGKGLDAFEFDSPRTPDPSNTSTEEGWASFTWRLLDESIGKTFGGLRDAADACGYIGASRVPEEQD